MNITIVTYTFPPSNEIGGRRWAKFSQYLNDYGNNVTVVCADQSANIDWYQKSFPGINVVSLPKRYPSWLSGYTKTFIEKSFYYILTRFLSPVIKHNLFDKGFAWRKALLRSLENLHSQKKVDVLIVTGAPFSVLYYGALFKNKFKEVFTIADLRDPWTWGSYYGIPKMNRKKKRFQEFCENQTLTNCDLVSFSTKSIGEALQRKYPQFAQKLYLLPHAYEPGKFKNRSIQKGQGFIYGGSLYPGIDGYLKRLSEIVKSNPDKEFKWNIYTGTNYPLIDDDFANGKVKINGFVPEVELFQKIQETSAYLVFFPETDKDLISTKFFEIIYAQTPILYIGEEGDVSRLIKESKCGVHILPQNMEKELPAYLDGNVPFEPGYFDISNYTFENVTKEFLKLLEHKWVNAG